MCLAAKLCERNPEYWSDLALLMRAIRELLCTECIFSGNCKIQLEFIQCSWLYRLCGLSNTESSTLICSMLHPRNLRLGQPRSYFWFCEHVIRWPPAHAPPPHGMGKMRVTAEWSEPTLFLLIGLARVYFEGHCLVVQDIEEGGCLCQSLGQNWTV